MEMTTIEVLNRGMQCLVEHMGIINAEQFISTVIREKIDYTKWQREAILMRFLRMYYILKR